MRNKIGKKMLLGVLLTAAVLTAAGCGQETLEEKELTEEEQLADEEAFKDDMVPLTEEELKEIDEVSDDGTSKDSISEDGEIISLDDMLEIWKEEDKATSKSEDGEGEISEAEMDNELSKDDKK